MNILAPRGCATTIVVGLLGLTEASMAAAPSTPDDLTPVYIIRNVFDVETRSAIAATGALIVEVGHDYILVEASAQELRAIQRLSLNIGVPTAQEASTLAFPPADSNYHDYAEMVAEIQQAELDHSAIFDLFSLGTSYEGRTTGPAKSPTRWQPTRTSRRYCLCTTSTPASI